jgi:hypothetical protein
MNFLHQEFDAGQSDLIEVTLDHPANVQLLDPINYRDYQSGRPYRYYGGYVRTSPFQLTPPRQDRWHLVVDLGGMAGSVRAVARVISGLTATTA